MDPTAASWALCGDALAVAGLRLAFQRIGRMHWRPQPPLRSWALAPLWCDPVAAMLCVACADDEVLWLGCWRDDAVVAPGGRWCVTLADAARGRQGAVSLPPDGDLVALAAPGAAPPVPIDRAVGAAAALLALSVQMTGGPLHRQAVALLPPADWQARSGRTWQPLDGPPPLPPRLG